MPEFSVVLFVAEVPEFRAVIGEDLAEAFCGAAAAGAAGGEAALQRCFTALMTRDADVVKTQLDALTQKLSDASTCTWGCLGGLFGTVSFAVRRYR